MSHLVTLSAADFKEEDIVKIRERENQVKRCHRAEDDLLRIIDSYDSYISCYLLPRVIITLFMFCTAFLLRSKKSRQICHKMLCDCVTPKHFMLQRVALHGVLTNYSILGDFLLLLVMNCSLFVFISVSIIRPC